MGCPAVAADGTFTGRHVGAQEVKLFIIASAGGQLVVVWYRNDFAHGLPLSFPDSGTTVVDVAVTDG